MSLKSVLLAAAAALGLGAGAARAEDRYYMMIFASQARPNVVQASHTFALFAKVTGAGPNRRAETAHISWLPTTLRLDPLRRDPEPGTNLGIARTLEWAQTMNAQVSMWGPFPIKKDLYDMAVARAEQLASGRVQYVVTDGKFRRNGAVNCIHAVSDMDRSQPELNTGTAFGVEASKMVLSHFEPYILPSRDSNRWLVDSLSLNQPTIRTMTPDLVAPTPAVRTVSGESRR